MKQILKTLLFVATLFLFTSSFATAASNNYPAKWGVKLGNGFANSLTGIAEIPKSVIITNRTDGPAYAATAGFMTGLLHMVGRTLCGTFDIVTFMIPTKPIVRPDLVWQKYNKETGYRATWELLP